MNDRRSLIVAVSCPSAVMVGWLALSLSAYAPALTENSGANAAAVSRAKDLTRLELADIPRAATIDDGIALTVGIAAAAMPAPAAAETRTPDAPAPTVKLASADPGLGRSAREGRDGELPTFTSWYGDGKPRVVGQYDRDGLRTRTWRFWHEGGVVVRAVSYDAGVRHGSFKEWYPDGRPKTDGAYVDGERDGRWLRWDVKT